MRILCLSVCCLLGMGVGMAATPANTAVWANVSSAYSMPKRDASADAAPNASLVVIGDSQNLGPVDGDRPVVGEIEIANHGTQAYALIVPGGIAATPVRVKFPAAGVVVVPAGGDIKLPFDYDARLADGPGAFDVVLASTDPGAQTLYKHFAFTATPPESVVGPFRDLLTSQSKGVDFFFAPAGGGDKFVSASVENPDAPIKISVVPDPATGRLNGVATLDPSIGNSPAKQGSSRIIGVMASGKTAYFWLQWSL